MKTIKSGLIIGCTGEAAISETLEKPYQTGNLTIVDSIKAFFRMDDFLSIYPHDTEAFDLAAQLRTR
ncbi:MAG: hypothetical protein ACYCTV_07650 [Leptospirales bacterium]